MSLYIEPMYIHDMHPRCGKRDLPSLGVTNYVQVGEGWCFTMQLLSSCKKLSLGGKRRY